MNIAYINGRYLPKNKITISPDDRGFLFADGVYEVIRWYEGFFYDMEGHLTRLKRSLRELRIDWKESDSYPSIARELIRINGFENKPAMIYLQVTRGTAPRTHSFPAAGISPTVYAYAFDFVPDRKAMESGIRVMLKEDIRWSRCDIKSIALLPNTLSFQEAYEKGMKECLFVRNGKITEGSRSNAFFIINKILFTHPESNFVLSGVTRKNILRIAQESGIQIKEEAVPESSLPAIDEAFISNTSAEVTPVIEIGGMKVSAGAPGPVTILIKARFEEEIRSIKQKESLLSGKDS
jgi:D-alanine transaminase